MSNLAQWEPFVTAKQVAAHFMMSESAVRKATNAGENPLPHHRIPGGRSVRYRFSEVSAWLTGDTMEVA
jgi:predicted DNA-binding transcriptional regulator AlpA